MTQNSQFCPICNFSNLFSLKWLRMTWNGQFHMICNFSNLFPLKLLRMTWNSQFSLIHNFSNLSPLKWLRMTWNGQFHLICNFSNLFPPKWLRMTWNGQFCMAKIKYTLIQGNFYERLPFYMDSCALRPMASLFVKYTEKKTSVFQIQLEFWVNMTLCFWLMYPPWKSWILSELQLFQSFPTKVAQNDSEQLILFNLQLF